MWWGFGAAPGALTTTGWSSLSLDTNGASNLVFLYKTATGSEGATVTFTTGNSVKSASVAYRITGWQGTPEKGTAAGASSTNADPPSITPSWGSDADLFLAAYAAGTTAVASAAPTNYTSLLTAAASAGSSASVSAAQRNLTASSDDPGTFTNASTTWVAQTVAIRAAAASGFFSRYYYDMNRSGNV
jgi:hypothetical protein